MGFRGINFILLVGNIVVKMTMGVGRVKYYFKRVTRILKMFGENPNSRIGCFNVARKWNKS